MDRGRKNNHQRHKQHQQANRKRGRQSRAAGAQRPTTTTSCSSSDDTIGIEEQLRRQRLRKQQQEEENNKKDHKQKDDTVKQPAPRLGSYVYDPLRQAYFEESYFLVQQQQKKKDVSEELREYHDTRDSVLQSTTTYMSYAREICANERKRRHLTGQWRGRQFFTHLGSEKALFYGTDTVQVSWPCPKESPWSRTFDVVASDGCYTPPRMERIERDAVVGRTYGKWMPAFMDLRKGVTHIKALDQKQVELFQSESECHVIVRYQLQPNTIENRYTYEVDLPPLINDCTSLEHHGSGPGAVLFAGGRRLLLWSDGDLGGNSGRFHCSPQIPKSDILTVENLNHPSSVLLGHRNGQVSLQDLRATNAASCAQLPSNKNVDNEFGSVVALHPLNKHRPYQVLARSNGVTGGHCRLFDVRMFVSSSSSSTSAATNRSAVVHDLRIPNQQHGKKHISKGVATDPGQTVALAPFVDDVANTAQIGVWSLDSGMFVGSKPVSDTVTTHNHAAINCLELCPKITPTWTMESRDDSDDDYIVTVPDSFSLWLNCGSQGIRQISCDGRWDD